MSDLTYQAAAPGSPPRVRGKLDGVDADLQGGRLTPACAGKTPRVNGDNMEPGAHPRVCGENCDDMACTMSGPGSPPRVRGKHIRTSKAFRWVGLTPACAGKTTKANSSLRVAAAHPRVCGENPSSPVPRLEHRGSPPRVRGKRSRVQRGERRQGLTPACAGKTWYGQPVRDSLWAHPRVCGENAWSACSRAASRGSPPRVRGKLVDAEDQSLAGGLTPACAGKTAATA